MSISQSEIKSHRKNKEQRCIRNKFINKTLFPQKFSVKITLYVLSLEP